jgi:glutamate decarboxylase
MAGQVADMGPFSLVSDGTGIPAFAFRMRDDGGPTVYDVSEALRGRGWLVPAYPMPESMQQMAVLRVVVRNGFSRDLAELFVADLRRVMDKLLGGSSSVLHQEQASFSH